MYFHRNKGYYNWTAESVQNIETVVFPENGGRRTEPSRQSPSTIVRANRRPRSRLASPQRRQREPQLYRHPGLNAAGACPRDHHFRRRAPRSLSSTNREARLGGSAVLRGRGLRRGAAARHPRAERVTAVSGGLPCPPKRDAGQGRGAPQSPAERGKGGPSALGQRPPHLACGACPVAYLFIFFSQPVAEMTHSVIAGVAAGSAVGWTS